MLPIAPRFRTRRILALLTISSAVFLSAASIAGCQNETTAQPPVSQLSTEMGSNSATPSLNQTSVPDPTPTPMPSPTTSATTPPVLSTSVLAAPRLAPPAPRPVPASTIAAAAPVESAQE